MTYTDWEFTHLNGDGYPDVLFNSSPVLFNTVFSPTRIRLTIQTPRTCT